MPAVAAVVSLLTNLNDSQSRSVQHPPSIPLQILAGPGSGKTKVLTSRIAYLILHHHIPAHAICAVTFTNKAALEMRTRLTVLIGPSRVKQLKMGTFHALCALFLRKYGRLAGLEENFTICDADESAKVVSKYLKPLKEMLAENNITLKPRTVCGLISHAKSKGVGPKDYIQFVLEERAEKDRAINREFAPHGFAPPGTQQQFVDLVTQVVSDIYRDYELELRKSNSLDFDDLLIYGVKLFRDNKKIAKWCQHVLVDEFQDTNGMQYDLMKFIARAHKCVTVVGDPDQSIYGWRSADIENIRNMQRDFPPTTQIFLEQNYRSTGSILAVSLAIISKDAKRIQKTLRTTHMPGPRPMLMEFPSEHSEALFIAAEIKRAIAASGGMLDWRDFAVLLRFNALSRGIEAALQMEGIPNRVLNGHKFFERAEIKDLLSYLQLIDNALYAPAFRRIINVPARGLGEKSVEEIFAAAERAQKSPLAIVEGIYNGSVPDTKPAVKRKIAGFVKIIRGLRKLANEGMQPADLLRRLIELIAYEDYLRKTQPDWDTRWENVQELINFARQTQEAELTDIDIGEVMGQEPQEPQPSPVEAAKEEEGQKKETPLRLFLQASMLSTDTESKDGEDDNNKVTISTCHAAKGLEWPAVFVPAVEDGVFPFHRSEDQAEERRLLYVACTRAQGLLYLLNTTSRMVAGIPTEPERSPFITDVSVETPEIFSDKLPDMKVENRELIARVIGRPPPDEAEVERLMREFKESGLASRLNDIVYLNNPQYHMQHTVYQAPPALGAAAFTSASGILTPATTPRVNTQPRAGPSTFNAKFSSANPKKPAPSRATTSTAKPVTAAKPHSYGPGNKTFSYEDDGIELLPTPPKSVERRPAVQQNAIASSSRPRPHTAALPRPVVPVAGPSSTKPSSSGSAPRPDPPASTQYSIFCGPLSQAPTPAEISSVFQRNAGGPSTSRPHGSGQQRQSAAGPSKTMHSSSTSVGKTPAPPTDEHDPVLVFCGPLSQAPKAADRWPAIQVDVAASSSASRQPPKRPVEAVAGPSTSRAKPPFSTSTGPIPPRSDAVAPPTQSGPVSVFCGPESQAPRPRAPAFPTAPRPQPAAPSKSPPGKPPGLENLPPVPLFADHAPTAAHPHSSPAQAGKRSQDSAFTYTVKRETHSQPVPLAKELDTDLAPAAMAVDEAGKTVVGVKRRLGMGRPMVGYANKKFKRPA